MTNWMSDRQGCYDRLLLRTANRVSPATSALRMPLGIFGDVMDHIVVSGRIHTRRDVIKVKGMTNFPRDDMISARRVPTDPERTDEFASGVVKSQPAAENV